MYLLTGGSGSLGTELQKLMAPSAIWAPSSKYLDLAKVNVVNFYKHNRYDLSKVDTIIHCAAYTDVPGAELSRAECMDVNIIGTSKVVSLAKLIGARVIYISTDYVYSGIGGNYDESHRTEPVNFYGLTKLAGEGYLRDTDLVIRTSFKPSEWPYPKAFSDIYCSADYIDVIAEKIANIIVKTKETGILNVGTERKSVFELAKRRNPKVLPMSRGDIGDVRMPEDISMNIDKLNEIYKKYKLGEG